ncbi:MAG TPA: zinc ribbon domain-containing protein [Rhizomicrobium sp.]
MALRECPECKHEISDAAPACPSCGYVQNQPPKRLAPGFLLAAIITLVLCLGTPRILLVLPVAAAVILSIVSLIRREPFRFGAVIVILLSLGLFAINVSDLRRPSSASVAESSGPCSPADFTVSDLATPQAETSDYIKLTGMLHNGCSQASGAQLKWTVFNSDGTVAFSDDFWPDSTTNLPPNGDFPFDTLHSAPNGTWTYKVEVISTTAW